MITIDQMIQREVLCCMSSLVSTLARISGINQSVIDADKEVWELANQASELAAPVLDYEEAARDAGWQKSLHPGRFEHEKREEELEALDWEDVCNKQGLVPYEWEVYEHWAVSNWLAEQLIAQGERVDTDFAGLNIWARTCTGLDISMDGVIQKIYDAMVAPV